MELQSCLKMPMRSKMSQPCLKVQARPSRSSGKLMQPPALSRWDAEASAARTSLLWLSAMASLASLCRAPGGRAFSPPFCLRRLCVRPRTQSDLIVRHNSGRPRVSPLRASSASFAASRTGTLLSRSSSGTWASTSLTDPRATRVPTHPCGLNGYEGHKITFESR